MVPFLLHGHRRRATDVVSLFSFDHQSSSVNFEEGLASATSIWFGRQRRGQRRIRSVGRDAESQEPCRAQAAEPEVKNEFTTRMQSAVRTEQAAPFSSPVDRFNQTGAECPQASNSLMRPRRLCSYWPVVAVTGQLQILDSYLRLVSFASRRGRYLSSPDSEVASCQGPDTAFHLHRSKQMRKTNTNSIRRFLADLFVAVD
ncbi:hypothetical protein PHSY_006206 [Pseudozyma hubeiensis SY62]|uniref:Uncharacterized protein n=1 Tax=Pseudozyma hubeiensis (strain SY62) TaxID=1305764 RepID=R9PBJ5_PSEHS|nr:hypothetical protein PHSY_006206 [Pseudozyma hubeiensis SY62]GAC98612.1 hypothetical protein PHSY_006206 [Pseudozyma hubeiensis SY62]